MAEFFLKGAVTRRAVMAAALLLAPLHRAAAGEERVTRGGEGDWQTPNLVRAAQRKLNTLGHDAGVEDGLMGPNTRRAIRSFQAEEGMAQTGEIDRALLVRLGLIDE